MPLRRLSRRGASVASTVPSLSASLSFPPRVAVDILLLELLVHAWDFAKATGQEIRVDESLSAYVLERARGLIVPEMRGGDRFAAERPVGPQADNLARLVAYTGREH